MMAILVIVYSWRNVLFLKVTSFTTDGKSSRNYAETHHRDLLSQSPVIS